MNMSAMVDKAIGLLLDGCEDEEAADIIASECECNYVNAMEAVDRALDMLRNK